MAGTVDSHKNPKLAPKINALILLAGKNINKTYNANKNNQLIDGTLIL